MPGQREREARRRARTVGTGNREEIADLQARVAALEAFVSIGQTVAAAFIDTATELFAPVVSF